MSDFNELLARGLTVIGLIVGFWLCWRTCCTCTDRNRERWW